MASATETVQKDVDEVIGIMNKNITKVLERGENLNHLQKKASDLEGAGTKFGKTAQEIEKEVYWRNYKFGTLVCMAIMLLVAIGVYFSIAKQRESVQTSPGKTPISQ